MRQEIQSGIPYRDSLLEREIVAEVVETATELLVARATRQHELQLWKWVDILEVDGHWWLWTGKARSAGEKACEQVETLLKMLVESPFNFKEQKVCVEIPEVEYYEEMMWMAEVEQINSISSEEEETRELVAREIQHLLQYQFDICRVQVYGSAKSLYGSSDSDLYMCLHITRPSTSTNLPKEVLGFYYLKRLLERKAWDDDRRQKSRAEKIEQLRKARTQVLNTAKSLYQTRDDRQRQTTLFFNDEMQLLADALDDEVDEQCWQARGTGEAITTSQTERNADLLRVSKRRKNDLFDVKATLEQFESYQIEVVASHARVPVLRFRYLKGGLDYKCDLCFDNELGVRNTRLLRAYASFDERARKLGLAVKHWSKQRGITDTASGFLSSYSFVLLSIYYLQIVHVLPNLQDPRLLKLGDVSPVYYDGANIAFCKHRDIAQLSHQDTTPDSDHLDATLPALLLGFFDFYATEFDWMNHVVTIRCPEIPILKTSQWGNKAKNWRMSIQDPLETTRDVGGVLHFSA